MIRLIYIPVAKKILTLRWDKSKLVYKSQPILMQQGDKLKITIKVLDGSWNCDGIICDGLFKATVKATGENVVFTSEYDFMVRLLSSSAVEKTYDFEIVVPYAGHYSLELMTSTENYPKAYATIEMTVGLEQRKSQM